MGQSGAASPLHREAISSRVASIRIPELENDRISEDLELEPELDLRPRILREGPSGDTEEIEQPTTVRLPGLSPE